EVRRLRRGFHLAGGMEATGGASGTSPHVTAPNPYAPPNAPVSDVAAAPQSKVPQYIVAILVGLQLLGTLQVGGGYVELVNKGALNAYGLLFGSSGSLCLYVGAVLAAITGVRGRVLFILGAVGLGLLVWNSGGLYPWTVVAAVGAVLGVAGWWITSTARNARMVVAKAGR